MVGIIMENDCDCVEVFKMCFFVVDECDDKVNGVFTNVSTVVYDVSGVIIVICDKLSNLDDDDDSEW